MMEDNNTKKKDPVGKKLYLLYVLFLLCSMALVGRIVYIQFFFKPEPKIMEVLKPKSKKVIVEPSRGSILASDGRLLAMSLPIYNIYMDCTVMKDRFAADTEHGKENEAVWMNKARKLSEGLSEILEDKSADEYYKLISSSRERGRQYVKIATGVERKEFNRISELPLFNEDRYHGGMIVEKETVRRYPYGKLARRTIGFVRNNRSEVSNTHIGIEGRYDHLLHGKDGLEWQREADNKVMVHDSDSASYKAEDGYDIRTTLNIDIQDITDAALREQIEADTDIEGGCAIVMDVKTGAIRAMVNLLRDTTTSRLEESMNLCIGRLGEPGSVFKASTLMTVIEDGKISSLDEKIPTNHGLLAGFPKDDHISDYERKHNTKEISILDGFKMSSNYVFRYLAVKNYAKKPKSFLDKIYMYKLGEAFDFDLEGLETPKIPSPDSPLWSGTDLGSIAIGYSVSETPLHILTFYNGIANKGKLMKPYIVEKVEKQGIVKEKMGPGILNAAICSKATADTLTRALKAVTEEGTATRLKNAKCQVAGKTGTSRILLDSGKYEDQYGRKKNQATFVGFFPADDPKYSIIVVVYSTLSGRSFYGGTLPAATVRTVVDKLYAMDPCWEEVLEKTGSVPKATI